MSKRKKKRDLEVLIIIIFTILVTTRQIEGIMQRTSAI